MKTGENLAELRIHEFASEYFGRIYYYCLKKTGGEAEAAELSQETALAVIEQLRRRRLPRELFRLGLADSAQYLQPLGKAEA